MSLSPAQRKWSRRTGLIAALLLGLVPIGHGLWILAQIGAPTPSSDDFRFFPLLDQILSGQYRWAGYLRDTVISNGHSIALPFLIYSAFAKWAQLDVSAILYLGFGIQCLNLLLAWRLLSFRQEPVLRAWIFSILSLLLFSNSLISMYGNSFYCLQYVLALFGFLLGAWGIALSSRAWAGLAWAVLGGFIGLWSFAGGVVAWPLFAALLLAFGYRRKRYYVVLGMAAVLALLPYLFIPPGRDASLKTVFAPLLMARGLGLYFTAEFSEPRNLVYGLLGLAALVLNLLVWFPWFSRDLYRKLAPSLAVMAYGLLNFWQITLFRDYFWPWYTPISAIFWVGLTGLGFLSLSAEGRWRRLAGLATLALLIFLVLPIAFGQGFLGRSEALRSRAPASASCLRNYANSPTYCQWNVAWWRPRYKELGEMGGFLQKHHLSPFASGRQSQSLQGDFVQSTVEVFETSGVPDIAFSRGLDWEVLPWSDARHADLFLHSPNAVSWRLKIPARAEGARLISAAAISQSAPRNSGADGAVAEVQVRHGGQVVTIYSQFLGPEDRSWREFSIDLDRWAGKEIEIHFSSDPLANFVDDWVMFRFPQVEWSLSEAENPVEALLRPSNVEGSPEFPKTGPRDFVFPSFESEAWSRQDLAYISASPSGDSFWLAGIEPTALFHLPTELCLGDYSHLYWQIGAPLLETWAHSHIARVFLQLNGRDWVEARIPLLFDEGTHAYSFDLKLLELPRSAKLTELRVQPVEKEIFNGITWLKLGEFRLVASERGSACP